MKLENMLEVLTNYVEYNIEFLNYKEINKKNKEIESGIEKTTKIWKINDFRLKMIENHYDGSSKNFLNDRTIKYSSAFKLKGIIETAKEKYDENISLQRAWYSICEIDS